MAFVKKDRILILFFMILQIIFWFSTKNIKPIMHILPPLTSEKGLKAFSLGDEQFHFRYRSFELQNAGDLFGRFTALKKYDYEKLEQHLYQLDFLDPNSHFTPSIASYYYSQTQNPADVIYIVKYLEKRYNINPEKNWWWLFQATYLANHKLKDKDLALRLALKLSNSKIDLPIWAKQMPAFIYEQIGEHEQAYIIIKTIVDDVKSGKIKLPEKEMNFMKYFIEERIEKMKEATSNE